MQHGIISADNHVVETPGTFIDRVAAAPKERLPGVLNAVRAFDLE